MHLRSMSAKHKLILCFLVSNLGLTGSVCSQEANRPSGNIKPYKNKMEEIIQEQLKLKWHEKHRTFPYLILNIDKSGKLLDAEIAQSSGNKAADSLYLSIVKSAKFAELPAWYLGQSLKMSLNLSKLSLPSPPGKPEPKEFSIPETIAYAVDGRTLCSASVERIVKLWDPISGKRKRIFVADPPGKKYPAYSPFPVLFAPGCKSFVCVGGDKRIQIWDLDSGKQLRSLSGISEVFAFSPDAKILASSEQDKIIRLWDLASGKELRTINGEPFVWHSLAFSADGKMLAGGSFHSQQLSPGLVKVWDVNSGRNLHILSGHKGEISSLAFSPRESKLATAGRDKMICLWDANTGKLLHTLRGHAGPVHAVSFSPDGKIIASASGDATIRLWDSDSGKLIHSIPAHQSKGKSDSPKEVWSACLAFSPDGKTLCSNSGEFFIWLWDVGTGKELRYLAEPGFDPDEDSNQISGN